MDGLFHEKPYEQMGWFGGTIIFGNHPFGFVHGPFSIAGQLYQRVL